MIFPYDLRSYQVNIIDFIANSLQKNEGVAVESPTGSGKTVMGLVSALKYREMHKEQDLKILYLTRTNSQQEQIIKEVREINNKYRIKAVPIQGRGNLCPLYTEIESSGDFNAESLSRFCALRKKRVMEGDQKACRYFNGDVKSEAIRDYIFSTIPTAEEFYKYGKDKIVCPYESLKNAIRESDIVIAPYAYFLNFGVANRFLHNWGAARDRLIIIMDEAHNLPDLAREMSSFVISVNQINLTEKESLEFGDFELMERIRATDMMEMLRNTISDLVKDRLSENDESRIRFDEFREYFMISNSIGPDKFRSLITYLNIYGEYIAEQKEKNGKVPRSHVLSLSAALMGWEDIDEDRYVAIISRDKYGSISAVCLDPTAILSPLKESKTIHLSGTLDPLEIYKNVTGFPDVPHRIVPYIFPEENRSVLYYEGTTTKFDEFDNEEALKMHGLISNLINETGRNTIVFFPSYSVMERVTSIGFDFRILEESRKLNQSALMSMVRDFRKGGKPIFAVSGGRISEGLNFPGAELEMVIIAGIPYPRPDAKQKSIYGYYEHLYRNGWEYSVTFPTVIKLKQEIGRLIRTENDKGMAVILDKRAAFFRKYIPYMKMTEDPVGQAGKFFDSHRSN